MFATAMLVFLAISQSAPAFASETCAVDDASCGADKPPTQPDVDSFIQTGFAYARKTAQSKKSDSYLKDDEADEDDEDNADDEEKEETADDEEDQEEPDEMPASDIRSLLSVRKMQEGGKKCDNDWCCSRRRRGGKCQERRRRQKNSSGHRRRNCKGPKLADNLCMTVGEICVGSVSTCEATCCVCGKSIASQGCTDDLAVLQQRSKDNDACDNCRANFGDADARIANCYGDLTRQACGNGAALLQSLVNTSDNKVDASLVRKSVDC